MRRDALVEAIREAWSEAEYPGDFELAGGDDCQGEYTYVSRYFRGKRWDELTFDHLRGQYEGPHYACMSFMSAGAYAYYLGAMMIMAVDRPEDPLMDSVVFGMTRWWLGPGAVKGSRGVPDAAAAWTADRWGRLSEPQTGAVLRFLEYVRDLFEEKGWAVDELEQALDKKTRIPTPD